MKPLPRGCKVLRVTPISRGPTVEMISGGDLAPFGVADRTDLEIWCADMDAYLFDVPPDRFSLDVTAAYALGLGHLRVVFVHEVDRHLARVES